MNDEVVQTLNFTTLMGYAIAWSHPDLIVTDLRNQEVQNITLKWDRVTKDDNLYDFKYSSIEMATVVPCTIDIRQCGRRPAWQITINPKPPSIWSTIDGIVLPALWNV